MKPSILRHRSTNCHTIFRRRTHRRRGAILILTVIFMIALLAMLAFALDLGYVYVARSQMQRSADSAAIAAAWELVDEDALLGLDGMLQAEQNARAKAAEFAALNPILTDAPNLATEDVEIGYLANPSDPNETFQTTGWARPNAVKVRLRRSIDQNGQIPLLFAPVLGTNFIETEVEATAAIGTNVGGFRIPADGGNIAVLPFALDLETWSAMLAGEGEDNWTWDSENEQIVAGPDGILEMNLYPQGTGSPGNRGTIDIGSNNNSTADIARQILHGASPQDMEHHGGKLEFDENGEITLNGDTGISAGVNDELASITGKPRIIPVFNQVVNPGNNADYTIVAFVGIRVLDVKLTGSMSSKRVTIQPAIVVAKGAIPKEGAVSSYFVYSSAWLVR